MTYAMNIFMRVLSGLAQRGTVSQEKRKLMAAAFLKAKASNDAGTCADLLKELLACTENAVWRKDLSAAIESIG